MGIEALRAGSQLGDDDSTATFSTVAERLVAVSSSRLFQGLSKSDQIQVALCGSRRAFARKERLCTQGEAINKVLLLESGCVKLEQLRSNGNRVILWVRGAGDALGLFAPAAHIAHSCSAYAVVEGTTLEWEWSELNRLKTSQQIRMNISQILADEFSELEDRFCEIATGNVPTRVALCLARVLRRVGENSGEGIEVHLSRQEIAQCTGTTEFAVSRLMSTWEAQGFIVSARRAVVVRFPDRLAEMAQSDCSHSSPK